jgi:hypothetical protein
LNLTSTTYYRAVVTNGVCSEANSSSSLITVDPAAAGGTISGGTSVCTGTNSTLLTLSGNTGSITKWQSSTNGGSTWSDIVNTTSTYTATNLTATTLYRAVITSGSCSTTANSASATVTVNALPQGSLTGNGTICPNSAADLTWTATAGSGPYSVVSNNGTSNSTQNSVTSGIAYTTNASLASNTTYTLVSVTDNNGCVRSSSFTGSSATITVRSVPTWANLQSPSTANICGTTVSVYGQVYGSGITDGAGATSNLTADLGYSSSNTNPNTWTNWIPATFNTQVGNNDEFTAELGSGLSTGTWYYAYRYSYYGCDYIYGGTGGVWSSDNGVATVPTSQTITLSSSAGTNAQSFCKGTSLTNITYTLGAGANAATVTGLPSGVSYSVSGSTLTISGTPTGSGNSTYTITTSGTSNCPVIATGTITVNETLDLVKLQSPASATICPSATLDVYGQVYESGLTEAAGAGAGITVQAGYSTTNNNPSNWTNWFSASFDTQSGNNDQYTYNFSGLSAGTYYYAFKYSYNGCVAYGGYNSGAWDGSTNVSGTLTVTSNNTAGAASSTPTLCINTVLTNITHATTGATGIGTASGLPTGVSVAWASNTLTISGTPSVAGTYNYTIPLSGGCGSVSATGTIIVSPANTAGSASSSPTLCVNSVLSNITHATTGATGISSSGVGGANGLPPGVSAAWASNIITISGTPTSSGTYNYTIPLTGGCGSVTATGTIIVNASNTASAASSSPTLCINTVLTNITHSTTGTSGISNNGVSGSNGLPAGVSASWSSNTITISGTPTVSGSFSYSIPMTGGCSSVNATGTIIVNSVSIGGSISGGTSVCTGTNSTILTLSGYTGSITKWQSSTTSDFSSSVTDITNTSTTYTATNLTTTTYFRAVVTNGSCSAANSSSATITVNSASVGGSVAGSTTVCTGTNSSVLTLSGYTGSITKWQSSTVSDFSSSVVDISNSTTTNTATNLTTTTYYRAVITSGVCSATYSSSATVTVNPTSVGGSVTGGTTVCTGTNSTLLTLSGNTGTVTKWQSSSVSDFSSAVSDIVNTASTYTATNLSATTYFRAVVTSGVCTSSNSVSTTITVSSISVGGSVSPSTNSICSGNNQALVLSAYTGNVTNWESSTSSDFSTGVSNIVSTNANYTATNITTPTYFRAVVTNGVCPSANSTSSAISLTSNNTITLNSANGTNAQSLCVNIAITSITYTTTGATGATFTGLPTGVSGNWSANSVTISGTPSTSGVFSYTVTMTGGCTGGTNTASGTITVDPLSVGGSITGAGTVCSSTNSTILTLVGNTGSVTKWQSSLNNSVWNDIAGTAGSSTYTATDLASTTYYRAQITSGSCSSTNSSTATITYGTATKYWAGKGSTVPGFCTTCTDFNNATHWSSSNTSVVGTSAPSACDNIVINVNAVVVIGVSANTTVNSLSITSSAAAMVNLNLAANVTATINTTTTLTNNQTGANYLILSVNNGSSWIFNGDFTAAGSATGTTYTVPFCGYTTVLAATTGTYTFKGNATFGAQCTHYTTYLTNGVVFDGSSAQTITWSNANAWQLSGSASGGVTVGSSNTANVTFAGAGAGAVTSGNNLTIGANSTLDLASRTLNRTATGAGTLLLNSGSTLQIGGTNTFPINYTTNTLTATSTVEYNGTNQTVTALSYSKLTLSGSATKTITGLASIGSDFTTSGTAATGAASTGITIGGNVTLGSGTTFNAGTSLTHNVAGNWTNNGATYSFTTGNTVNFNSTAADQAINGTAASQTFNNITVNKTGRTLSVGGSTTSLTAAAFTITAGTFTAPTTLNISGNFANSGTFTHNSGTATFNGGAAQTLNSGGSSFNNVSITNTVTGVSLLTNNLTVAGTFTLNGAGGFSAATLTNTVTGAATLTSGTYTASTAAQTFNGGLTVNGGTMTGSSGTITTTSLTQSSGTITAPGSAGTFNVSGDWNRTGGTFTHNSGTVTFNGSSSNSISGSATSAFNNLTVNKGSSISTVLEATGPMSTTALTLTNGLLRLTHASATATPSGTLAIPATAGLEINGGTLNAGTGSVTNSGLFRVVTGAASIGTASGNALTSASGSTTDIQGGTLTVSGRIQNTSGSFAQSGGTITLCTVGNASGSIGNFDMSATTNVNITNGTIINRLAPTFNAINILSGGTKTITGGTFQIGDASTTASQTFLLSSAISLYNLTVNNTNAPIAKLNANITVSNNLTLSGGTYDANTYTSTITNLVTVPTGATYLASTGTQTLSAGLTVSGGTFTGSSGTVTTSNMTLSSGTFTAPSGTFNVSGNWTKSGGTFTHNSGTVVLNGSNQTLSGSTDFYSFNKTVTSGATLTLPASATQTFAVGGTLTLQGAANNLLKIVSSAPGTQALINPSSTTRVIDNNNANGTVITATNSYDAGNLTNWAFSAANLVWTGATNTNWNTVTNWAAGYLPNVTDNVTITKTGANQLVLETSPTVNNITISANNTVSLGLNTLTVKGTWLNNGTLTPGTSTVAFAGTTGTQTVNNGANSFYNVTHTGASTLQSLTNAMTIGGTFTNSAGTFDANSLGNTFTGAVTLSGGTFTAGSSSQTFNGGLTVSGGTFTGSSGAVTTTNLTMTSGTLTAPSGAFNVSGNWATTGGTYTPGSNTVTFTKSSGTQTVNNSQTGFYNLVHSGAGTLQLVTNHMTVTNDITNSDGTLDLNNLNLTIGGNYSNSVGIGFTPGVGSVIFNKASGTQTLSMEAGGDFSNIQHTTAGTLQLLSDLAMTGNLTNSAGTLDVNGYNIVIGGNWTNSATFLPGTGATYVALNGSSGTQTIDNGSSQFNDLQVIGTAEVTMTTPAQSFGNVTVNGPLSSTAQLVLVGGDAQSITSTYYTGGTPIPFQNLTVNKTVGVAVTLTKPVRVTGTLTMTQGDVVTDATNILEVGTSASSVGSVTWTAGTVRGPMKRWFAAGTNSSPASGIFPVGGNIATTNPWTGAPKGVMNRYVQVNFTTAPSTGGYIIAKYVVGNPGLTTGLPIWTPTQYIQNFEEEGYWDITPYSAAGVAYAAMNSTPYTLKLRLNMPSTNDGSYITAPERIRIISSKGPDHNTWVVAGAQGAGQSQTSTGDYLLEETGVTGFSWFNGGGDNFNPLPVELLSFSGLCEEGIINLTWQTASEFNSSHFDVEKSRDGENWQLLTTLPSAGTSNELITYQSTDQNGTDGNNYFRLRQVDNDGKEKLYDPINVSCIETTAGYFSSFPNPSGSSFQVIVNNKEILGACKLNIVDAQGKVVDQRSIEVKDGINLFVISETLNPGIYFLNITNGTKSTPVLRHAIN